MYFGPLREPYDARFNPLGMVRRGTPDEEADAFSLAHDLLPTELVDRDEAAVRLAGMIRIVLRANPNATLDDLRAACRRVEVAQMRDAYIKPN
jgi:hypothetical protein